MTRRVLLMISSMRGGGSEQQILLLLRHLDRKEFTPELYVTEREGDLLSAVPDDVQIHSYGDTIKPGGINYPGRILKHQIRYFSDLVRARQIDVIYDRTFHMTMVAGPSAQAAGIPRVSTIVSPPNLALPAVEKRFVWLKRRRLAKAYRQSRTVVAVSQEVAVSAESYYELPAGSVQVIRNPVDLRKLQEHANGDPFNQDDKLNIVCVGRMTEEKGHEDLIAAMALSEASWGEDLPQLRLTLIGDGPLRGELERRWRGAAHRHEIQFLGSQRDPTPYIAAADALVLPSHFEGMPNVVLEAMALETPVIATRSGGTVELERDVPTILWAEPKHPPSLAAALVALAKDPRSARSRAVAAKSLVDQYHDVVKTTRQIEGLLA